MFGREDEVAKHAPGAEILSAFGEADIGGFWPAIVCPLMTEADILCAQVSEIAHCRGVLGTN